MKGPCPKDCPMWVDPKVWRVMQRVGRQLRASVKLRELNQKQISMKPKFTVFQGADKLWYFHITASNGKIIAQSEGYTRRRSAVQAILSFGKYDFRKPYIQFQE